MHALLEDDTKELGVSEACRVVTRKHVQLGNIRDDAFETFWRCLKTAYYREQQLGPTHRHGNSLLTAEEEALVVGVCAGFDRGHCPLTREELRSLVPVLVPRLKKKPCSTLYDTMNKVFLFR